MLRAETLLGMDRLLRELESFRADLDADVQGTLNTHDRNLLAIVLNEISHTAEQLQYYGVLLSDLSLRGKEA